MNQLPLSKSKLLLLMNKLPLLKNQLPFLKSKLPSLMNEGKPYLAVFARFLLVSVKKIPAIASAAKQSPFILV